MVNNVTYKLIGARLRTPVRIKPRKQVTSRELSVILRRRMAFELSSSSNDSIYNDKSMDEWDAF